MRARVLFGSHSREPDHALLEPLVAVIHAAPRTELRELHVLREMLMSKVSVASIPAFHESLDAATDRETALLCMIVPRKSTAAISHLRQWRTRTTSSAIGSVRFLPSSSARRIGSADMLL